MATSVSGKGAGLRLAVIAGTSVFVSVAALAAGLTGNLPPGVSTIVVLVGVSIGLRVAWSYAATSASSPSRAATTLMISNGGLAISAVALLASLPRLTQSAGVQTFLIDLLAQLWTIAVLTVVAGPVRTLGWRAFAGVALTGFLAITGLARFVGRPLIENLGASNLFAVAVWVPVTEELVKLIPVGIVLALALRRTDARPSALDAMLLGAWTGAGFAVYENAALGRGSFSLWTNPVLSLVVPSTGKGTAFGWPVMQTGHLVHTALIALAVAFAVLYGRRIRRAWIAAAVAIGAVLLEHCSQNAMAAGDLNEIVAKATLVLTLGGWLTSTLLVAGVAYVMAFEWRIVGGAFRPVDWFRLQPAEALRRAALLARAQSGGAA
jgi:RsiW-degrading membrane proteinase PrsW (M82 family)